MFPGAISVLIALHYVQIQPHHNRHLIRVQRPGKLTQVDICSGGNSVPTPKWNAFGLQIYSCPCKTVTQERAGLRETEVCQLNRVSGPCIVHTDNLTIQVHVT